MDTKAYIESGIVESYVLGLCSNEEAVELELLCDIYPEVKTAVDEFAVLIEKKAFENAVAPPAEMKQKLMMALAGEFTPETKDDKKEAVILPFQTSDANKVRQVSMWRYVAAASIILLVVSAALNFYYYNNYQSASSKYQALLVERNSLQANNDAFRTKLNGFEESMSVIKNPDVKMVTLGGVAGKENNLAAVYYNAKTKDVYFLQTRMDQIPSDKQYQLWAIVDGKPVDAGVIENCDGLCKLKNISNPQAFAITLEQKGGSPTPTLTAMYVLGKV